MKTKKYLPANRVLNQFKAVRRNTSLQNYFLVLTFFLISLSNISITQEKFIKQDVSFSNDSVQLTGSLLLPNRDGKFPAVIYIHGSGPMTRKGFKPYAEEFAKLGTASLFYDKRGTGSSGGSWLTSSLQDLADDALAAVNFLKQRNDIDQSKIGFWGVSQAGWIATIAASQSSNVGFMILISGGGASPRESELFSWENEFEKAGISEEEKTEARKILNTYFDFLATGKDREALNSLYDKTREGILSPLADQLEKVTPSDKNRPNWSWVGKYDPSEDIAKIKCPVLLMFGEKDKDHPTELSVNKWKEGLQKAGNDNVTLMVFSGAGHGIRMREGYIGEGRAPFADGYAEIQLGWLWQHVVSK